MGAAGRAAAEENRMELCVERYFELYERLLGERAKRD
jgi:hypothetical protein